MENVLPKPERSARGRPIALGAATAGLFLGWFVLDTLVVREGPVGHAVKFYEMSALIADPPGALFGVGPAHTVHSIGFGLICAACMLGPWVARWLPAPHPRVMHVLPLSLMLLCAALLYWRTSGDLLATPERASSLASDLLRLANDVLDRGAGVISRSVKAGAGSWVALASAAWLCWIGRRS